MTVIVQIKLGISNVTHLRLSGHVGLFLVVSNLEHVNNVSTSRIELEISGNSFLNTRKGKVDVGIWFDISPQSFSIDQFFLSINHIQGWCEPDCHLAGYQGHMMKSNFTLEYQLTTANMLQQMANV